MTQSHTNPSRIDPDESIARATRTDPRVRVTLDDVRGAPDCIKILDLEGRIVYMSRNGMCAMEIPHHDVVKGKIWWDLWPEALRDTVKAAFDGAMLEIDSTFRGECATLGGTMKAWEVTVKPVLGGGGQISNVLSVSREIPSSQIA